MKKRMTVGIIILIIAIVILSIYSINNSTESFDSTVEQLGFISTEEYKDKPARLVCQDFNGTIEHCNEKFPFSYFRDNCDEAWTSLATTIYICEDKKYIYYAPPAPSRIIKIAEIK
ncbi:hypothetical protein CMI46_01510 [Candidatus Pacearchaeota archaeon]|nr:hypothetical protein [Candidatus Pacearchaeota archaeon]|tara:strand:- start:13565 stop:13912 length:348 start_codon:yes stop_codon:yes gene_type:complete